MHGDRSLWLGDVVSWQGGNGLFCNQGVFYLMGFTEIMNGLEINCFSIFTEEDLVALFAGFEHVWPKKNSFFFFLKKKESVMTCKC